jgi:hypothetical protein
MIAQLWKLPAEVQEVLANHHSFPVNQSPKPLSAAVALAEDLSQKLGHAVTIGPGRCDLVSPATLARAREALGLTAEQEAELRETGEKLATAVTQDFASAQPQPVPAAATKTASAPAAAAPPVPAKSVAPRDARLSLWRRLGRMLWGK